MIGKAIAGEAKATFFYISASSLTSKWVSANVISIIYIRVMNILTRGKILIDLNVSKMVFS